jgi:hypothetical protein
MKSFKTSLHLLVRYYSYDEIQKMSWARNVAHMGSKTNAYSFMVGKPLGTKPLRKYKVRWEIILKNVYLKIGMESVYWVHMTPVDTVVNFWVPQNVGNFLSS